MKADRENKNKQKIKNLASIIIYFNYCYIMIIDKKQLLIRRREMYDNVGNRITEPQNKDKPHIRDVIDRKAVFETNKQTKEEYV